MTEWKKFNPKRLTNTSGVEVVYSDEIKFEDVYQQGDKVKALYQHMLFKD